MSHLKKPIVAALLLPFALTVTGCIILSHPAPRDTPPGGSAPTTEWHSDAKAKNYEVVGWTDISYLGKRRRRARVILDREDLPTIDDLKHTAELVRKEQPGEWDETSVFLYMRGMDTDSLAYGIVEFVNGLNPTLQVFDMALYDTPWYSQTPTAQRFREHVREEEQNHLARVEAGTAASYTMSLALIPGEKRTLTVICSTDLPAGTVVSLVVGRTYRQTGADARRVPYAEYYYERDLTVTNGGVRATVRINDAVWFRKIKTHIAKLRSLGIDVRFAGHSDNVFVRAVYTSYNKNQPSEVVKTLGKHGEYVGGPLSKPVGEGRAMSVEETIAFPLIE